MSHGQEASSAAVRSFLAAYQAKTSKEEVVDALSRSLLEANRAVLGVVKDGASGNAGTTLVAAVVLKEELYWISAGDSRIYWLHNNELTRLTADHVYATKLNRDFAQGRISRSEARNHPERASLTSYLGQPEPALADRNLRPLILHDNDCVLLCSDGFYRGLTEAEIANGFHGNPQHACDSLVQLVLAKNRKQQDNLTAIALKSGGSGHGAWNLSERARRLLVAFVCIVVLSGIAGYWFTRHPFLPSASSPALRKLSPPVTVSKPTVPEQPISSGSPGSNTQPQKLGDDQAGHAASTQASQARGGKGTPPKRKTTAPTAGKGASDKPGAHGANAGQPSQPGGSGTDQHNPTSPQQTPDKAQPTSSPVVPPAQVSPSTPTPQPAPPQDAEPPRPEFRQALKELYRRGTETITLSITRRGGDDLLCPL
jgi:protein phosphatase